MNWPEICTAYPKQWLIIEALEAHTTPKNQRFLDRLAVIETCNDGQTALQRYRYLHQAYPDREFYFVHTSRKTLEIHERQWHGIRSNNATVIER